MEVPKNRINQPSTPEDFELETLRTQSNEAQIRLETAGNLSNVERNRLQGRINNLALRISAISERKRETKNK